MASAAPSALFARLVNVWKLVALRSDVDDMILELLGRFSLEKIYISAGDKEAYQKLVITLLVQLTSILTIQRLTLPAENNNVGLFLGFLVSWEVALRSVELVLHILVEGRESLWEEKQLRDRHLAEFLLTSLRVLGLHPRPPANLGSRDRRERFARVNRLLEQVFDSYPGPKSFLLVVARDVTSHLQSDPGLIDLPKRLKAGLPSLLSELYPLPRCVSSECIAELVAESHSPTDWLGQFLTLRDISKFVVGASVQYAVNQETGQFRNVRLQSTSARTRTAVLKAVDNLQLPSNFSKVDLLSQLSACFRIILPDTLDLSHSGSAELYIGDLEIDALDTLASRLAQRRIIHRVSDTDASQSISQVLSLIRNCDPDQGHFHTANPEVYVLNCPGTHIMGISQLRNANIFLTSDPGDDAVVRLSPSAHCPQCGATVAKARELLLAKQTWRLLSSLISNTETVNFERHLPTQFNVVPEKYTAQSTWGPYSPSAADQRRSDPEIHPPPFSRLDLTRAHSSDTEKATHGLLWSGPGPLSPNSVDLLQADTPSRSDGSTFVVGRIDSTKDTILDVSPKHEPVTSMETAIPAHEIHIPRRGSLAPSDTTPLALSPTESTSPKPVRPSLVKQPTAKRAKSKWMTFGSKKKVAAGATGDSSSISSTALEGQRLEEVPLDALANMLKTSSRGRGSRNINVQLSQNSSLALFWTQSLLQICDVGTSPPTMVKTIPTDSTCIAAAIAKVHVAYVIGSRDKRLTLRVANLTRPSAPVIEHRMSSSSWCKSIAIDPRENYVAIGFENSIVRFFKTTNAEPSREDKLHAASHDSCKACPPVDTLSFSQDGLVLLASSRDPRTGVIRLYCWRFPFETFEELRKCWYQVPLHESEDNGISSAVVRPHEQGEDPLLCVTTWTQSGVPLLIQPRDGHRSEIRTEAGRQSKIGNRIQCAAFAPSGREMALVNEKGHVFEITSLDSSPLDIRRVATTKELTAKSESFAMTFMTLEGEDSIVVAWTDTGKSSAWVKKIPLTHRDPVMISDGPGIVRLGTGTLSYRGIPEESSEIPINMNPVELAGTELVRRKS